MDFGGGWNLDEREAMVGKLKMFYEAYYGERFCLNTEDAEDMALRSVRTLQYNDIFTMREIFRLLYDASRAVDALTKRNLVVSVFNLLLVYDERDRTSWPLAKLHKLWKETMNKN